MQTSGTEITDKDIRELQEVIRNHSVYDFSDYSISSLKRRATRILEDYGSDFQRLLCTISSDPVAMEEVVKKITVNTTELFRDPGTWKSIMNELLPRYRDHSSIRIWHPGCSSGQEVYSMMILLEQSGLLERSEILATDLNSDMILAAQKGEYRLRFNRAYIDNFNEVFDSSRNDNTQEWKPFDYYFSVSETMDLIKTSGNLNGNVTFKKMDLLRNNKEFHNNFDIIVCRNVIIYFNYNLQNRTLHHFHKSLRDNGSLVLGLHESIIGECSSLFTKQEQYYVKRKV